MLNVGVMYANIYDTILYYGTQTSSNCSTDKHDVMPESIHADTMCWLHSLYKPVSKTISILPAAIQVSYLLDLRLGPDND